MESEDKQLSIPAKRGREEEAQDCELFVGSLSFKATQDDIHDHFSECGEISNVKLIKDYDGRSRGRAFVMFATSEGAAAGMKLHEQEHMGRQLVVKYSSDRPAPRTNRGENDRESQYDQNNELFVRSLSYDASEEDIEKLFSQYGEVINVKLIKDYNGKSRGRAFIKFASQEGAEAGLKADGKEHMDRELVVSYSSEKPKWEDSKPSAKDATNTIYVRNMSYSTSEDKIRDFFDQCGYIEEIRLAVGTGGYSKGFAHIEFDNVESSKRAIELSGNRLDGRPLQIKYAEARKSHRY